LAMDKLMDAAERLYAEQGFAAVSIRQISDAAGQRNKSVVQYHFSNRDELIKAIIARHVAPVERVRMEMVAALVDKPEVSLRDRVACGVLPSVSHSIELGVPSWYSRFMAQVLVEPSLRDYALQSHMDSESVRLLRELPGVPQHDRSGELVPQMATMIRQLVVHMSAELEYDLAHGRVPASKAESSWRELGEHLLTAVCGISIAFFGKD
ncbi:MAG TPA: helix-turn-helix domain-containing protein, partial [Pseudonocardiaceae bacterium]